MDDNKKYKTEIVKNIKTKYDLFAKVEVVGDLGVGKTSIFKRLIKNEFVEKYTPTVGYEFNPYLIKVNNTIIKFQIWDMCGNDNYRPVSVFCHRSCRKAHFRARLWYICLYRKHSGKEYRQVLLLCSSEDKNHSCKVQHHYKECC